MKMVYLEINLILIILMLSVVSHPSHAEEIDWGNAQWIGYTEDNRIHDWSERLTVFNSPPHDISTWVPKEAELKGQLRTSYPSPLVRKAFVLGKSIRSARVSVCGLGLYELHLNGDKVGDRVLDPAQTSYDKHSFYVVHDVTKQLNTGENVIGLMLGNGFYGQNVAFAPDLSYGAPRALVILDVEFNDNTHTQIISDGDWKATQGPILFDNIYRGETYDARLALEGWCKPSFDDSKWELVSIMGAPTNKLVEQELEPMRKIRPVYPVSVMATHNGEWIIDMGQNMTGWLQIRVGESRGKAIKMRFAELLMPDGKSIDPASTGIHATGGEQTDIYICKGVGPESWEPHFTYHGFRYVQISGLSKKPEIKDFTGWLVRTDAERIGNFECSDTLINKFYDVSIWTIEDNFQGLLSDCPHRERCAWMGDCHAVGEAFSYNFDLRKFWRKASADIESMLGADVAEDGQGLPKDPRAPCNIAVGNRKCGQARPDWGAATVLIPWFSYLFYGDLGIVKEAWPVMVGWMAYLNEFAVNDGIISAGYGDWCPPGDNSKIDTPVALTSTALYYRSLIAMQRMAVALGKTDESVAYANESVVIFNAFNSRFYKNGDYGSQTADAVALQSDLVPEGKGQEVADMLSKRINTEGGYSTGIFGHRPLYTILNDYGHAETTQMLWGKTDWPSLGFLTEKHHLTTWPEVPYNWEPGKRYLRNSFNHPMHAGFAAAFHESIGGIRPDSDNPGFKQFILKPCFLPRLEWAKASHVSQFGEISSSWKRKDGFIEWVVNVPAKSSARVILTQYSSRQIKLNGKLVRQNAFDLKPGKSCIIVQEQN